MAEKLFGTDGVRGIANKFPITPDVAVKIGAIIGARVRGLHSNNRILIGKDTRLSGYMLENAISAGLLSAGMNVFLAGPIPTPAVGFLTRSMRCDMGIMLSASHNIYQDNGIKLFDHNGEKLSNQAQMEIEHEFYYQDIAKFYCSSENIGRAKRLDDVSGRYVEFVKKTFPQNESLSGIRIVIDSANGANYKIAPEVLWELDADIITIGSSPNGTNINHLCGSTDVKLLQEKVLETRADIGIALDGDGDRLIVVDELGNIVDGDQIIAALAMDMQKRSKLNSDVIVTTIMSNLGLDEFLRANNLQMLRTDVGDKNVYDAMKKTGSMLGGEQSGHIILRKYATTGDGLMCALQLLAILKANKGVPASKLLNLFTPVPQYSDKVRYLGQFSGDLAEKLDEIKQKYEKIFNGRIVLRKSGTENIIRIMLETKDSNYAEIINKIKAEVTECLK